MAQTKKSKQYELLSQAYNLKIYVGILIDEMKADIPNKPFYYPIIIENAEKEVEKMLAMCNGEHQKLKRASEKRRKGVS